TSDASGVWRPDTDSCVGERDFLGNVQADQNRRNRLDTAGAAGGTAVIGSDVHFVDQLNDFVLGRHGVAADQHIAIDGVVQMVQGGGRDVMQRADNGDRLAQ